MSKLDASLDAVAVSYLSFGFFAVVNNLWTWVAFLTAALSYWKVRASESPVLSREETCHDGISRERESNSKLESSPASVGVDQRKAVADPEAESGSPVDFRYSGGEAVAGGKLTWYYFEVVEGEEEMEEQPDKRAELEYEFPSRAAESSEGGDTRWRWRRDPSWHKYQDLTVFNGNVVRLWDCQVYNRVASHLMRHSSCYGVC